MCCGAWRGWTHVSRAEGGQFMDWCAVFLFGSTRSFPDRLEQRATGDSPCWGFFFFFYLCLQLSVSLLRASGGESGAA